MSSNEGGPSLNNQQTSPTKASTGGGGLGHSEPLRSVQGSAIHGKGLSAVPTYHHRTLLDNTITDAKPTTSEVSAPTSHDIVSNTIKNSTQTVPSVPRKQVTSPKMSSTPGPPPTAKGKETSLDNEADLLLSQGPLLRPPPLLDDERGIIRVRTLVSRRAWADVVRITSELLQTATSPYASFHSNLLHVDMNKVHQQQSSNSTIERLEQETSEIISWRFIALLKLKRYNDLGREVDRLNLLDEFTLPWVPYGLQILAAHTLQYTETNKKLENKCADKLNRMKYNLSSNNQHWLSTLHNTLSNVYLSQDEFRLALSSLQDLLSSVSNNVQHVLKASMAHFFAIHNTSETLFTKDQMQYVSNILLQSCRMEILSRQGRILLQIGAISEAEYVFECIEKEELHKYNSALEHASRVLESDALGKLYSEFLKLLKCQCSVIQQAPIQIALNKGLLEFAKEEYGNAMDSFKSAIDKQRLATKSKESTSAPNLFQENFLSPGLGLSIENTLITSCLNNLALCALYTCQMKKAVEYMEDLICENPTMYLTEGLAFNLCTLYELGSENSVSGRKKNVLQHIAKRFFLHDITAEYFRIV